MMTVRCVSRFLHVAWAMRAIRLALAVAPPVFCLGIAIWFLVLVDRLVGMEHVEVVIGAAPSYAVEWSASLILCTGMAGVWHVLAARKSTRTVGAKA